MPRFVPSGHASPFCTVIWTPFVIGSHCGGVITGVHSETIAQPKLPLCVARASKPCAEQSVPVEVVHMLKAIWFPEESTPVKVPASRMGPKSNGRTDGAPV